MANINDILSDIKSETSLINGVLTLIKGLRQHLQDLLNSGSTGAQLQSQIDDAFNTLEVNHGALTAVLADNTDITATTALTPKVLDQTRAASYGNIAPPVPAASGEATTAPNAPEPTPPPPMTSAPVEVDPIEKEGNTSTPPPPVGE